VLRCFDEVPDQDANDRDASELCADDTARVGCVTTSVVASGSSAAAEAFDVAADTENNLARLEIMTSIAGGGGGTDRQNADTRPPRRSPAAKPSRSTPGGRRSRAPQSRTRPSSNLLAPYGGAIFDAMSTYKRVFDGDSADFVDLRRDSRDISQDLDSSLPFPGVGTYSNDAGRCLHPDLTADGLFPPDGYQTGATTSEFQQHQRLSQSYASQSENQRFQVAAGTRPPSCHHATLVRDSSCSNFTSLQLPPPSDAPFLTTCDSGGWPAWAKDRRWNKYAGGFSTNAVDFDDSYLPVAGDHVTWRRSVDACAWATGTGGGHDVRNDVIRATYHLNPGVNSTWKCESWNGDCSAGDPRTYNYVMPPYYDRVDGSCDRTVQHRSVPALSRFYNVTGECCYVPTSTSMSPAVATVGQEMIPRQSAYQSCKYSGVVDGQYTADESGCLSLPFVNTV